MYEYKLKELLYVETGGIYSYQWALKVNEKIKIWLSMFQAFTAYHPKVFIFLIYHY